jgi:hypothetical protein
VSGFAARHVSFACIAAALQQKERERRTEQVGEHFCTLYIQNNINKTTTKTSHPHLLASSRPLSDQPTSHQQFYEMQARRRAKTLNTTQCVCTFVSLFRAVTAPTKVSV